MPFGGAAGEGLEHGAVTDDAVGAGGLAENDRLGHSVDGGLLLHPDAGYVLEALAEQFSSDAAGRDEGVVDVPTEPVSTPPPSTCAVCRDHRVKPSGEGKTVWRVPPAECCKGSRVCAFGANVTGAG